MSCGHDSAASADCGFPRSSPRVSLPIDVAVETPMHWGEKGPNHEAHRQDRASRASVAHSVADEQPE